MLITSCSEVLLPVSICSIASTRKVADQYDLAFFYCDCLDGTLRGWMLAGQANVEKDGKCYCVMRVCGTVGHP